MEVGRDLFLLEAARVDVPCGGHDLGAALKLSRKLTVKCEMLVF